VKSILAQTFGDFNLIILDNCSTDDTPIWLNTLNDSRIRVIGSPIPLSIEENWARISTIDKDEFITLIGHDDLLNPNYLETIHDLILQEPAASLYTTHFEYIDSDGHTMRKCKPMHYRQTACEFLQAYMHRTIDSTGTGYVMRSKDFDAAGGMDPSYKNLIFADIALWLSLTHNSYKVTSPAYAFKYRVHDSVSKLTGGDDYQQGFEKFIQFILTLMNGDPKIADLIHKDGKEFLLEYCQSLSHRILKTPKDKRNISVDEFILKCKSYAALMIPGQEFEPEKRFKIRVANLIDREPLIRRLFLLYKKFQGRLFFT